MADAGKNTRRTQAAEASKKAILDAAEALFAEKGYDAASLPEICDLAGVTRGLPNYFFASKEQLYRPVLARTFPLPLPQDLIRLPPHPHPLPPTRPHTTSTPPLP